MIAYPQLFLSILLLTGLTAAPAPAGNDRNGRHAPAEIRTGETASEEIQIGETDPAEIRTGETASKEIRTGEAASAAAITLARDTAPRRDTLVVYLIDIREEIAPGAWRTVQKGLEEAEQIKADRVLLRINTYGGQVDVADSIRTRILNTPIPTLAYIDNNAASAGALIAIACDSIYMRRSASMGAATVVNQSGEVVPDKYQSYMRAIMRATARSNGRDPRIAEAMVDPAVYIPGVIDSGKVLTFTSDEAIANGFCEGKAENIEEVLRLAGVEAPYRVVKQEITATDRAISWLIHPAVSSVLILLILGGIYFELQSPGIGFPLAVAVGAALLYFAPLYLEGLAANWEILLFVAGIGLLAVEIFVLPGFGVAGVAGIGLMVFALISSLVGNEGFDYELPQARGGLGLMQAMVVVMLPVVVAFLSLVMWGQNLLNTRAFRRLVLTDAMEGTQGYSLVPAVELPEGCVGEALTDLRPVGRVLLDGRSLEARARFGYIEKGEKVRLVSQERQSVVVDKI